MEGQVIKFTVKGITTNHHSPRSSGLGSAVVYHSGTGIPSRRCVHLGILQCGQYVGTDTGSERQRSVGKAHQSANRRVKVQLSGPFRVGRLNFDSYSVVVLVASGIGITPAVSIMSSIVSLRHSLTRHSVTIPPGIVDIHLVWVVKSIQHSAWLKKKLQALHDVTSQPGSTVRLSISPYHTETGNTEVTSQ